MNAQEFAYWLQGFFELNEEDKSLTKKQVKIIRDHLSLVFKKVTPDRNVGDKEQYCVPAEVLERMRKSMERLEQHPALQPVNIPWVQPAMPSTPLPYEITCSTTTEVNTDTRGKPVC